MPIPRFKKSSGSQTELQRRASRVLFNQWTTLKRCRKGMQVFVRAKGIYLWDEEGRRYLDALSGFWCVPLGYGRSDIARRVSRQLESLSYVPLTKRAHPPAIELAERLVSLAPPGLERVFFCSGGSEGVDISIKLARRAAKSQGNPERSVILFRRGAYHGATLGATSVTGYEDLRAPYAPLVPGTEELSQEDCRTCPPDGHAAGCGASCVDRIETTIRRIGPERVAAMIAEPVASAGAVLVPPPDYWPRLQSMLSRYGILLILDEVTTGMGRTGTWFAASHWDIRPDFLILAKGLSGGYAPLGAVLIGARAAAALDDVSTAGFTFGGHPGACAAALATTEILGDYLENTAKRGKQLREGLESAARPFSFAGPASGIGLLASVGLRVAPGAGHDLADFLRGRGLLCRVEDGALCLAPPLTVGPGDIRFIVDTVREGFQWAAER